MDRSFQVKVSKVLCLILRHKPESIGIELDSNAWANVDELLFALNDQKIWSIDFEMLKILVESDFQSRFSFNNDASQVRANYGHSIKVDFNLNSTEPPEYLYHGTASKNLFEILNNGIEKNSKHHVHLNESLDEAVVANVKKFNEIVVFEISAGNMFRSGIEFYKSEKGVWLTEFIHNDYYEVDLF